MTITSYQQAVKYLESFIGKIIFKVDAEFLKNHDPLERMRVLLGLLGNPQNKFPSIIIGGTSGKSSTSYLISHILTTAGYKTGLTISPHLQKINERLQINGKPISDEKFVEIVSSLVQTIELMKKMPIGEPSYFEILIGMAFLYFVQQQVDIAVVEVGMGGEFDATNTLNPLIAVLTNVGLDHTNILGKTVQKIAKTKAGIIKKNLIVVSGVKQPSVIKIVEERCEKVGAKLFRLGKDFNYKIKKEDHEGSVFDLTIKRDRVQRLNDLYLSLLGDYQVENASLAIEVVLNLKKFGFEVSENAIRKALSTSFFPGRFEILKCHPEFISGSPANRQALLQPNEMLKRVQHDKETTLILDGAHNPTKMKAFIYSLKKLYPKDRKIFLIAFKNDKDIPKMIKQILKVADTIIVTQFHGKTDMSVSASASIESIARDIKILRYEDTKVKIEKDPKKALEKALNIPSVIVVTGSLYLVGEIRSML